MYTKMKEAAAKSFDVLQRSRFPEDLEDLAYKKETRIVVPISDEQRGELMAMTGRPA